MEFCLVPCKYVILDVWPGLSAAIKIFSTSENSEFDLIRGSAIFKNVWNSKLSKLPLGRGVQPWLGNCPKISHFFCDAYQENKVHINYTNGNLDIGYFTDQSFLEFLSKQTKTWIHEVKLHVLGRMNGLESTYASLLP